MRLIYTHYCSYTILPNRIRRAVLIQRVRPLENTCVCRAASGYMSNTVADFVSTEDTQFSPNTQLNTTENLLNTLRGETSLKVGGRAAGPVMGDGLG